MKEFLTIRRVGKEEEVSIQVLPLDDLDVEALRQGDCVNLLVAERVADPETLWLIFGPMDPGAVIYICPPSLNWPRLLEQLNCFPSAAEAAKALKRERQELDFKGGFQDLKQGNQKELRICLWKPLLGDWA